MHMMLSVVVMAFMLLQGATAQSLYPPGTSFQDIALAEAGMFVMQIRLNGDLESLSVADSPSGSIDEDDPFLNQSIDSDVPYPISFSFHFTDIDRSVIIPRVITPSPTYHARVFKESNNSPWLLKELWTISDGVRSNLPVPPINAQLQANRHISKSNNTPPTETSTANAPSNSFRQITCPRCKGETELMAACPFCGKRGYIWVESTSDNK